MLSFLTLNQGREIHTLALIMGASEWWSPDVEKYSTIHSGVGYGCFKEELGFCNWYEFKEQKVANTFMELIMERYNPRILSMSAHNYATTVFINWY